jgi:hypothetical protein
MRRKRLSRGGALSVQGLGDGAADAPGCAGNEGLAAGQIEHDAVLKALGGKWGPHREREEAEVQRAESVTMEPLYGVRDAL